MKRIASLYLLISLSLISFRTQDASSWTIDTNHSQLNFTITLLGLSDIKGSFKFKEAKIQAPKEDFSDAVVTMVADISSVDTDVDERDKHLRTADFFDAEKYPLITFKSSSFKKVSEGKYKTMGDLSFHGITRSIVLDVLAKTAEHPVTKQTVTGFRVSGIVKRSDFGIAPTTPDAMLSDEVKIESSLQFTKD